MEVTYKDNAETLRLISQAQAGSSRAENKLVYAYERYVDFMVRKYSKKTEIKEDDDLRSYIYLGLLDGIRKFNPKKDSRFIYFAHIWMKKNIFLGASKYPFIRIPVNQKIFYDKFNKDTTEEELKEWDLMDNDIQRYLAIEDSTTFLFTEMSNVNDETGLLELAEAAVFHKNITDHYIQENAISRNVLQDNINNVLENFNDKEVYIIEHLFGLNSVELLSSEQIAKNLNVTKVNITFTKTRVIRMMRHSSLSNKLINGI
jgi:RNA polymerase sigma factor (sigma-70 family)